MTSRHSRLLSYTEIASALTCMAQWDFGYGGRLAGSSLRVKGIAPILSDGRAWGAAVAAWHHHGGELTALWEAHMALKASLDEDARAMEEAGWPAPSAEERNETESRLGAMLDHYAQTAEPLPNLTRLEGEVRVSLPSRSGLRSSSTYRFHCFLDGFMDDQGQQWIVEFKLRKRLTDPSLLVLQRQPRWYAWALTKSQNGHAPSGVIVDERLNAVPKPARLTDKGRKPSHAKDQLTTPEDYADLCHEHGEMPKLEVMDALRARQWQQRFPLSFRPGEIADAGQELVSAARLIRDLDSGALAPIRNAKRSTCDFCRFRSVCAEPQDALWVESQFERIAPKRERVQEVVS